VWKKINNWFYLVTRNNWGLPWHLIIAKIGFDLLELWLAVNLVFAICFLTGLLYELWQLRRAKLFGDRKPEDDAERKFVSKQIKVQKTDTWQDLIANFIGILLGWLL